MKKKSRELAVHPVNTALVGARTPAEMIMAAVTKGTDLAQLEKLLEIQMRYEANEARKAYHRAMAAFRSNPIVILKNKRVKYESSKGTVNYTHATLDNVVKVTSAELSKHGLSASFFTKQEAKITVTCRITHELGHSEETSLSAAADESGAKNPVQAIGSTVTYLERYTLLAITGQATEGQDDDGNMSGKPVVVASTVRPATDANIVNPANECHGCGEMVSDKIRDYSKSKLGKCLCMNCQKNPPRA
jgi:hypothetical protein